jgi:hypothetical protein
MLILIGVLVIVVFGIISIAMFMDESYIPGIIMAVITVVFGIVPIIMAISGVHYNTGEGSQVGYVSAFEEEGVIFKTKRAYIKPTMESTQEDIYCVMDNHVYEELKKAQSEGKKIEVNHFSWLSAGIKNCKGERVIISGIK